ncbi:MAG: hypothetical protein JRN57_01610 [Nitrososphaerota archaeon]|nr:hypothetical protein [Nitrososphaerota archaeon]MDG7010793.1 hypothetical protein [Nitrososphaerota archaeon]
MEEQEDFKAGLESAITALEKRIQSLKEKKEWDWCVEAVQDHSEGEGGAEGLRQVQGRVDGGRLAAQGDVVVK